MKTALIHHSPGNRRLILIFTGWSSTPGLYASLHADGWDIMTVYDYSRPELDPALLSGYATVFILAWSLGVAAAEFAAANGLLDTSRIRAAFAVNGTPYPADDALGIPVAVYDGTEAGLSLRNLERFRRRMSSRRDIHQFPADAEVALEDEDYPEQTISRLRSELRLLRDTRPTSLIPWRRAYISKSDLIFPPANQRAAWERDSHAPQIVELDAGHYIALQDIISEITPNLQRIADRFSRAAATYDANASAQHHIAGHLASMPEDFPENPDLLEIGAGSGVLTRCLGMRFSPAHATFVDLYPLPRFSISPHEEYVTADAEQWLEGVPDRSYDIIASASTMQWFADPERFFANAARILRPGGILLCSTFLPGNLAELDVLRPTPLLYHTEEALAGMLRRHFSRFSTDEEMIPMDFSSPREVLMHLKLTGVGGGSRAMARNLLTALPAKPRITYHTLYILANKVV